MLLRNKILFLILTVFLLILIASLVLVYIQREPKIILRTIDIIDIKMANGIDEKFMPISVMGVFPDGTSKVHCWFKWKNAKVNTQITAKWDYLTDDIHILDYTFAIPRKEGSGSVALSMPEGKKLPAGKYQTQLTMGKKVLKSITFEVQ